MAVHRATPKNVEFALKENSRRQRMEKPVFALQPVEWVITVRALKRVRFAENGDDDNAEMPEPTSESAPYLPSEAASSSPAATPSTETAPPASAIG